MENFFKEVGMGIGTSNPTLGVIKSLISSGDIKLIHNSDLKYLLTSWQDNMANFNENEKINIELCYEVTDCPTENTQFISYKTPTITV